MSVSPFQRLFQSLAKTRQRVSRIFRTLGSSAADDEKLEELEALLLSADLGVDMTERIMNRLSQNSQSSTMLGDLRSFLVETLTLTDINEHPSDGAEAILIVGVNGTGKTTSAAKLAHHLKSRGESVMLVAADTYRAAAVEQLRAWCHSAEVPLVCNEQATDPTSVVYDGLSSASSKGVGRVIIDTAGRLHTYHNLMLEVGKTHRMITQKFPQFPVKALITLDASLGQNSFIQAREFNDHVPLDGIILTKLDGTARGGIVFPVYAELEIPVRYLGTGETLEDLVEFNAKDYVESLLGLDTE